LLFFTKVSERISFDEFLAEIKQCFNESFTNIEQAEKKNPAQ
jgi:hypothetical protein